MDYKVEGYEKITDLSRMQMLLREVLQDIHIICEENNLIYNMVWGTFLGAVRHKDIIPWDDDVDIAMPRPDYERLLEIIKEQYSDRYEVFAYPKENYIYPYAKICKKGTILIERSLKPKYGQLGLYVDIFPFDGIMDTSEKALKKRYRRATKNRDRVARCVSQVKMSDTWWKKPGVIIKWMRRFVLNLWGYQYFLEKQIEETKKYAFEDCETVDFVSPWGVNAKGQVPKNDFLNRRLYAFGDYAFWGMVEYDKHLKVLYGDYMTPPPVHKRSAPHTYDLYVKKQEQEQ